MIETSNDAEPVFPAATIVLMRDGADGLEVLLVQRSQAVKHMGGMWVFPGGRVDRADGKVARPIDLQPIVAEKLERGCAPFRARALAMAAVRETFEEAGLIGRADDTPIGAFMTPKIRPPLIWSVKVTVYPMPIDMVLDDWQEIHQRVRRFVTLDEARDLLSQPEMIDLAEQFWTSR